MAVFCSSLLLLLLLLFKIILLMSFKHRGVFSTKITFLEFHVKEVLKSISAQTALLHTVEEPVSKNDYYPFTH